MIVTKAAPNRLHLDLKDELQVRSFLRHCNATPDELTKAVSKVGNSLAALRKELGQPAERPGSAS